MTVICGFCEHNKPDSYCMGAHKPYGCQKPKGRKCPRGYSFYGGKIYDGIVSYQFYTAEELWGNAKDITELSKQGEQQRE